MGVGDVVVCISCREWSCLDMLDSDESAGLGGKCEERAEEPLYWMDEVFKNEEEVVLRP